MGQDPFVEETPKAFTPKLENEHLELGLVECLVLAIAEPVEKAEPWG